jgi:hypothetical protein
MIKKVNIMINMDENVLEQEKSNIVDKNIDKNPLISRII